MSIWALTETSFLDDYKARGSDWSEAALLLFKTKAQAERRLEARKVELMLEAILDCEDPIVWMVTELEGEERAGAGAMERAQQKAATLPKAAFLPHWLAFNRGEFVQHRYSFQILPKDLEEDDQEPIEVKKKRKIEGLGFRV